MNAKRYVWVRAPHHPDPLDQKRLPQADLASDCQDCAMPFGYGHLLSCALPQLYESRGEAKELLARWGEARAALVPNEKRSPELLLKETHACADGRLCDMQTVGGFDEASGRDDFYKSPGKLHVHVFIA